MNLRLPQYNLLLVSPCLASAQLSAARVLVFSGRMIPMRLEQIHMYSYTPDEKYPRFWPGSGVLTLMF